MNKFISTGVKDLDRMLGGGFLPGNAHLLEVEAGTEEMAFIATFLDDGIKKGEICAIVTYDRPHEDIIAKLKEFGFNAEEPLSSYSFLIVDLCDEGKYDPEHTSPIMMTENLYDPNSMLRLYFDLAQITDRELKGGKHSGARAVVYSLSSQIMNYRFEPAYKAVKKGIEIARQHFATSLTVIHPLMFDQTVVAAFEHVFDGTIVLTMKETKGRFQRFVRVKRSPLPGYYADEVPYDIVSNKPRLLTPFAEPISTFRNQIKYSADGSIDLLGMRLTMGEATYVPTLIEHFVGVFGYERVSEECYAFFKNYGKALFRKLMISMNIEPTKMDQKTLLETFTGFLSAFGLGIVSLLSYSNDFVSFRVANSLCSESVQTGRPMNPYLAGVFAGVVESVLSKPIKCVELKCVAKGDDCCEFACNVDMVRATKRVSEKEIHG
jgi:KaiC/GvpD/RAD55 family RecA-like ATPase/predicted hydrocarbon binding protein